MHPGRVKVGWRPTGRAMGPFWINGEEHHMTSWIGVKMVKPLLDFFSGAQYIFFSCDIICAKWSKWPCYAGSANYDEFYFVKLVLPTICPLSDQAERLSPWASCSISHYSFSSYQSDRLLLPIWTPVQLVGSLHTVPDSQCQDRRHHRSDTGRHSPR